MVKFIRKNLVNNLVAIAICAALVIGHVNLAQASEADGGEGTVPAQTVGIPAQSDLEAEGKTTPVKAYDVESGKMTLDSQWVKDNKVAEKTVVAVGRSDEFPDGMMRWVNSVKAQGDRTVLETRAARLNEALAGVDKKELAQFNGDKLTGEAQGVKGVVLDPDARKNTVANNPGTQAEEVDAAHPGNAAEELPGSEVGKPDFTGEDTIDAGEDNPLGLHINKPFGKDFDFKFQKEITKDSCTDGTFDYGLGLQSKPDTCSWVGDGKLIADFNITIGANGALVLETSGLKIQEASVTGGVKITGDTKLATQGKLVGNMSWVLADLKFPFVIPAGPVPITINVGIKPTVDLKADSDGNATATIGGLDASYSGVGLQFSSRGGVANDGAGGFEFLKGTPNMSTKQPDLQGESDLKATVGINPNLSVDLMGLLGIQVSIGAHANANFHISQANPICMLGFGMQGHIGLSEISLSRIPVIGWLFGGVENKLNAFIKDKGVYHWNVPSLYTSPNLCASSPIKIGDQVWIDLNKNGRQDSNEPGLKGAKVVLLRGVDATIAKDPNSDRYRKAFVAETVTGADGKYVFAKDPAFQGVKIGINKGKYAGKLMPGEYTVVVNPPDPTASDYAYKGRSSSKASKSGTAAVSAPNGFTITKRYVKAGGILSGERTLEDIQGDSGGKYAWNTNSYSSFFDGTRFQDKAPASFSGANPKDENKQDPLKAWRAEFQETKGYNDTVDFGFVIADKPKVVESRISGKVYVANSTLEKDGSAANSDPNSAATADVGVNVGNIGTTESRAWIKGAWVRLTPLGATAGEGTRVKTDIAGRFTAKLPVGKYRVSLDTLPSGYDRVKDATYSIDIELTKDNAARPIMPDKNWVNFGVASTPNWLSGVVFEDNNGNGQPDSGECAVPGASAQIKHIASAKSEKKTTDASGFFKMQFGDTKGAVKWRVEVKVPKDSDYTFTEGAVYALRESLQNSQELCDGQSIPPTCELADKNKTVKCDIQAKNGEVTSPKVTDKVFSQLLYFPVNAPEGKDPEPTDPTQPAGPGEPTDPAGPGEPAAPSEPGDTTTPAEQTPGVLNSMNQKLARTGTSSEIIGFFAIVTLSGAAIVLAAHRRKKTL